VGSGYSDVLRVPMSCDITWLRGQCVVAGHRNTLWQDIGIIHCFVRRFLKNRCHLQVPHRAPCNKSPDPPSVNEIGTDQGKRTSLSLAARMHRIQGRQPCGVAVIVMLICAVEILPVNQDILPNHRTNHRPHTGLPTPGVTKIPRNRGFGVFRCPATSHGGDGGI